MMIGWLREMLKLLERRRRSQKHYRQMRTIAPPNCPKCGTPMSRVGTIPEIYSPDGPTLLFRCDLCGERMEIQGWPPD